MNLLVVEDDKMIREGICEFLSEFGYKTYQAEDGKQAISIFENNEINLAGYVASTRRQAVQTVRCCAPR